MGKPILLLRLEGPLQSWGTRSRWDVRDTGLEPTKSGIIGLLGSALGYPMGDARLKELSDALRFGVRVEHPGAIMTDYQTVTDYLPTAAGEWKMSGSKTSSSLARARESDAPATIISPRSYLEDAAFLAGLEPMSAVAGIAALAGCAAAVQQPKWPLFLGRKACVPTRPVFAYFGDKYADLDDAFQRHQWEWLGAGGQKRRAGPGSKLAVFIEDESGSLVRQDAIQVNASRSFGFRSACGAHHSPVLNDTIDNWEVG